MKEEGKKKGKKKERTQLTETKNIMWWRTKKKKRGRTKWQEWKGRKKKERGRTTEEQWRRKKKKIPKGAVDLTSGSLHVCLITKMLLKIEL